MEILVIDGQGGGLGRQLVAAVKKAVPQAVVTAIGTNSAATSAMLKAGADRAATGENAVVVGCRRADVILGPIGIVMADALLGEITPAMAQAVAQSDARRILIPANRCDTLVVGVSAPIGTLVEQAAAAVLDGCRNESVSENRIKIHKNKMQKISCPPAEEHDTFCISIIKAISSCHLPYGAACTRMLGASAPQGRLPADRLILL